MGREREVERRRELTNITAEMFSLFFNHGGILDSATSASVFSPVSGIILLLFPSNSSLLSFVYYLY